MDPIEVVESTYDLGLDDSPWLDRLAEALAPGLPEHALYVCGRYAMRDGRVHYEAPRVVSSGFPVDFRAFVAANEETANSSPADADGAAAADYWARGTWSVGSMCERLGRDHRVVRSVLGPLRGAGIEDSFAVMCRSGIEEGLFFAVYTRAPVEMSRLSRGQLTRLALHVASADRLRRELGPGPRALEAVTAEAVLTPAGRVVDARVDATKHHTARDALRERVRNVEKARGRLRQQGGGREALDLWKGLVAGTWSLVDAHDSDGRRYVVAHRNAPGLADPRRLTRREEQVARLVSLGHGNGEVAYALGISESASATQDRMKWREGHAPPRWLMRRRAS